MVFSGAGVELQGQIVLKQALNKPAYIIRTAKIALGYCHVKPPPFINSLSLPTQKIDFPV